MLSDLRKYPRSKPSPRCNRKAYTISSVKDSTNPNFLNTEENIQRKDLRRHKELL